MCKLRMGDKKSMNQLLEKLGIDANLDKALILEELKNKKNNREVIDDIGLVNNLIASLELSLGIGPSFGPNKIVEKPVIEEKTIEVVSEEPELIVEETEEKAEIVPETNLDVRPISSEKLITLLSIERKKTMRRAKVVAVICSLLATINFMLGNFFAVVVFIGFLAFLYLTLKKLVIFGIIYNKYAKSADPYNTFNIDRSKFIMSVTIFAAIPKILYVFRSFGYKIVAVAVLAIIYFGATYAFKRLDSQITEESAEVEKELKKIMA